MKSLVPHVAPYLVYVAVAFAANACPWADAVRVVAVGAILVWLARRGAYPELRDRPKTPHVMLGVLAGVVVGVAWVPLAKLVPPIGDTARTALDPSASVARTAFRVLAMVVVVPFAEELFVRSALPRFIDAKPGEDWRTHPIGAFTPTSAAVSIAFFTLAHPEWLAALATAALWTALLAKTRNLRVVIVAHAVANAWLAGYVLVTRETQWW